MTNDRDDFLDLMSGVELHPGLVVILDNIRRDEQVALFDGGLEVISKMTSLINKVVEIQADGGVTVIELPEIG